MAIEGAIFKQGAIWNPVVRRGIMGAVAGGAIGAAYGSISDSPNATGTGAMLGGILGGLSGVGKLSRMQGAAELIGEKGNRMSTLTNLAKEKSAGAARWFEKSGLGAKTDDVGNFTEGLAKQFFGKQEWFNNNAWAPRAAFGVGKGAVIGAGVGAAYGLVSDNDSMFGGMVKGAMLGGVMGGIRYGASEKAYNLRQGIKSGGGAGAVASNTPVKQVGRTYRPTKINSSQKLDAKHDGFIHGLTARHGKGVASNTGKDGFWRRFVNRITGKGPKKTIMESNKPYNGIHGMKAGRQENAVKYGLASDLYRPTGKRTQQTANKLNNKKSGVIAQKNAENTQKQIENAKKYKKQAVKNENRSKKRAWKQSLNPDLDKGSKNNFDLIYGNDTYADVFTGPEFNKYISNTYGTEIHSDFVNSNYVPSFKPGAKRETILKELKRSYDRFYEDTHTRRTLSPSRLPGYKPLKPNGGTYNGKIIPGSPSASNHVPGLPSNRLLPIA